MYGMTVCSSKNNVKRLLGENRELRVVKALAGGSGLSKKGLGG